MTVGRILERKGYGVETALAQTTIAEISKQLQEQGIGAVIIVDAKENLLGIVSERDIVRALSSSGTAVLKKSAQEIMTDRVVTATEDEPVGEIMRLMTEGKFRHVPITRDARLVGLVSIGDLVKHRIGELENEAEAFRSYILAA
ncbi:MAG: CBS domain-containing protein [Pseudomonadota bacterium]